MTRQKSIWREVAIGVGILLIAGGSAPWWWPDDAPDPNDTTIHSGTANGDGHLPAVDITLTADLRGSPRRSGTLVEDGIAPAGWNPSGVLLSEPSFLGVSGSWDFSPPESIPGHDSRRRTMHKRGFVTFELSPVLGKRIETAALRIPIGGWSGSPEVKERETLIEVVQIGDELSEADYGAPGVLVNTVRARELAHVDVSHTVRDACKRGSHHLTFRLRFKHDSAPGHANSSSAGTLQVTCK